MAKQKTAKMCIFAFMIREHVNTTIEGDNTDCRCCFGEVIKRVHNNKEYIIVEKNGILVIAIMDADEFEDYLELKLERGVKSRGVRINVCRHK